MPFKPDGKCKTCQRIKAGDKALLERINRSKEYIAGGEPLSVIARDESIRYAALINHAKKHQAPNKARLAKKQKQHESKEALKEIQAADTARTVTIFTGQAEMRRELLTKAQEMFDKGDIKMGMSHVVSLLGQEQKAEEAAKDRGLALMKMFNYWNAQGGNPEDYKKYTEAEDAPVEGEFTDAT